MECRVIIRYSLHHLDHCLTFFKQLPDRKTLILSGWCREAGYKCMAQEIYSQRRTVASLCNVQFYIATQWSIQSPPFRVSDSVRCYSKRSSIKTEIKDVLVNSFCDDDMICDMICMH